MPSPTFATIEQLYTFQEVADLLGVHTKTLDRAVAKYDYDVVRLGARAKRLRASTVAEILTYGWESTTARAARAQVKRD